MLFSVQDIETYIIFVDYTEHVLTNVIFSNGLKGEISNDINYGHVKTRVILPRDEAHTFRLLRYIRGHKLCCMHQDRHASLVLCSVQFHAHASYIHIFVLLMLEVDLFSVPIYSHEDE